MDSAGTFHLTVLHCSQPLERPKSLTGRTFTNPETDHEIIESQWIPADEEEPVNLAHRTGQTKHTDAVHEHIDDLPFQGTERLSRHISILLNLRHVG